MTVSGLSPPSIVRAIRRNTTRPLSCIELIWYRQFIATLMNQSRPSKPSFFAINRLESQNVKKQKPQTQRIASLSLSKPSYTEPSLTRNHTGSRHAIMSRSNSTVSSEDGGVWSFKLDCSVIIWCCRGSQGVAITGKRGHAKGIFRPSCSSTACGRARMLNISDLEFRKSMCDRVKKIDSLSEVEQHSITPDRPSLRA